MGNEKLEESRLIPEGVSLQEYLEQTPQEQKDFILSIFMLLQQSKRFMDFFDANFIVEQLVNDKDRTVDLRVVEKDIVGLVSVTRNKIFRLHEYLLQAGVKDASKIIRKILEVFTGPDVESDESIMIAPGDFQKVKEMSKDQEILNDVLKDFKQGLN